jgi:acyl-CoA synthetase (AMP-forming)/AMP-acid ligase II
MADLRAGETFLLSPESGSRVTFGELRDWSRQLAHRLSDLGLSPGAKVAWLLDNGLFTAKLFLGTMYGGFVTVPLNPQAGRSQLTSTLSHADATTVFVSDEYSPLLQSAMADIGRRIAVIPAHPDQGPAWGEATPGKRGLSPARVDDDALLVYTSGSTGNPKGVLASHAGVIAGGAIAVRAHQLSPRDRSLCVLPLHHANAQFVTLLATLSSGGSVVMPRRFSVMSFWDWVAEYGCTWFALVPNFISQLLNWSHAPGRNGAADFRSIRFARSSSAPLPPSTHRAFEDKFRLPLIEAMGMTEVGGSIFSNPLPPGQGKIGSVGISTGFDVRVVDACGRAVAAGASGEIIVRGPSVMKGYYKNPQATSDVIDADGWLHTGDLGYQDEDGYFFLVGRAKELIIKGGENIAPREIEETLVRHPTVVDAAAVGVPDPHLGQDIVAYVVTRPGANWSEKGLLDFCERELGQFKTPSRIHRATELPRGPSGKLLRSGLAERAVVGDRAFLTAQVEGGNAVRGSAAARADVEKVVMGVWAELLGTERLSIHDNFFSLGGDSLIAHQIISRLRRALQVELPVRIIFEAPTVASFVARVLEHRARHLGSDSQTDRLGVLGVATNDDR